MRSLCIATSSAISDLSPSGTPSATPSKSDCRHCRPKESVFLAQVHSRLQCKDSYLLMGQAHCQYAEQAVLTGPCEVAMREQVTGALHSTKFGFGGALPLGCQASCMFCM